MRITWIFSSVSDAKPTWNAVAQLPQKKAGAALQHSKAASPRQFYEPLRIFLYPASLCNPCATKKELQLECGVFGDAF
jgi:hypothetical protein